MIRTLHSAFQKPALSIPKPVLKCPGLMLCWHILRESSFFIIPSTLCNAPVPLAVKQPQSMMPLEQCSWGWMPHIYLSKHTVCNILLFVFALGHQEFLFLLERIYLVQLNIYSYINIKRLFLSMQCPFQTLVKDSNSSQQWHKITSFSSTFFSPSGPHISFCCCQEFIFTPAS